MKSCLIVLLLAAHAGAVLAQYKCTAAGGAVTFQQTPCVGARSEEKLTVIPNGHPPGASDAAAAPVDAPSAPVSQGAATDKRMLAGYAHQRERDALAKVVKVAQDDKARRAARRLEDMAAAHRQFGDDPADAPALREALAAIDSRYAALGQIDDRRLKSAQDELDDWDRLQQPTR